MAALRSLVTFTGLLTLQAQLPAWATPTGTRTGVPDKPPYLATPPDLGIFLYSAPTAASLRPAPLLLAQKGPQADGPRPTASDACMQAEQRLSEGLERGAKLARGADGAWTLDLSKDRDQEKALQEAWASVRQLFSTGCEALKDGPLGALFAKPAIKAAIEEGLNSGQLRIEAVAKRLQIKFADLDRLRPGSANEVSGQIEKVDSAVRRIAEKIDALETRVHGSGNSGWSGALTLVLLVVLTVMSGGTMWGMRRQGSRLEQRMQANVNSKVADVASKVAQLERRVGDRAEAARSTERAVSRRLTEVEASVSAMILTQDERATAAQTYAPPAGYPSSPARPPSPPPAEEERQRRYKELLFLVREAMPGGAGFERLQAQVAVLPAERTQGSEVGAGRLRETAEGLNNASFWSVQFDDQAFLIFPGRVHFSNLATLAAGGGRAAIEMFDGIFEIDWTQRDLEVTEPAYAVRDEYSQDLLIQQRGRIGLFKA